MLYSNFRIPIEPRRTPDGDFSGAIMGKFESGSRRFYLEASRNKVGRFIKGDRPDLSLSVDQSDPSQHRWKVIKSRRQTNHLILSSRRPDGQDYGTGVIMAPAGQAIHLLDYAASGRLTHANWQIALLEASPGDVFSICIHAHDGYARYHYIVGDREVIEPSTEEFVDVYEQQIEKLKHIQRRHNVADLKGEWINIFAPNLKGTVLF